MIVLSWILSSFCGSRTGFQELHWEDSLLFCSFLSLWGHVFLYSLCFQHMIMFLDDEKSQVFIPSIGEVPKTVGGCWGGRGEAEIVCLAWAPHSRMTSGMLQRVLHVTFPPHNLGQRVTHNSFPIYCDFCFYRCQGISAEQLDAYCV